MRTQVFVLHIDDEGTDYHYIFSDLHAVRRFLETREHLNRTVADFFLHKIDEEIKSKNKSFSVLVDDIDFTCDLGGYKDFYWTLTLENVLTYEDV